jgi:hypothetical protein
MRKFAMIQILVLFTMTSFGQIKPIDLNEIKSISTTDNYKRLFDRYIANDTTLLLSDYQTIYYGQAFQDNFRPGARHDSIRALNLYLNSTKDSVDFRKVLNYTQQILKDFPFNIDQIYITGIAYDKIGEQDLSKLWFYKYDHLIRTILSTGDGKFEKTAFIVIKVTDEYSILNALGLNYTGQSLTSKKKKYYDLMSVAQNKYGIDKLYFDINLFFGKEMN